ncbi:MAG: ribokinase [Treponema sp.]|nr:ribokinase [Treponema sp.]
MKILVYGSLNIDLVFSVDHIVQPGETISSRALVKSAGGKGANQAAALGKAGMEVYMAGKIGEDGRFILDLLESYGVNTSKVRVYGGASGQALIQVDRGGQNSIVLYGGGNAEIQAEEIPLVLETFGPGDGILLQNEIPHIAEIIRQAKERGMKVYFNPSPFDEKILALPPEALEAVDLFFVNEIEGALLADLGDKAPPDRIMEALCAKFPGAEIILTVGKEGAYYGLGPERERGLSPPVEAVDTTGAGDTFTGYYIAARAEQPVKEALALACRAASMAVARKGAMEAIPFKAQLL